MSVKGEIIRITEAKTDIASAINEQGYTQVDGDASISTYADAIRANTNTIWEQVNINTGDISDIKQGYLPLTGGTVTGRVYISQSGPLSMFNVGNDDSMGVITIHAGIPDEYVSLQCSQDNILEVSGGLSVFEGVTAKSFVIDNGTNDYVLLAGGGTKLLSEISSDMSGYLPLEGGTLTGDLVIQRGESGLHLGNCELYFNNGGIDCTDTTSVSFYGFESSLSFDEGGYSGWISPVSAIHSDELTIGGFGGSEATIYLGHEQNNIISTTDQDSALSIWSAESISLSADGDSIYLNAPSVTVGEIMDVCKGQVTLYNDTRLDFTSESNYTTMGHTENGFTISNDGELKLTGDSIVVNSADSIYFSTSSDTTFDSRVYITNDVHAQAFYETSDARKKDIKSDLSLDKCYDLIDKCQTVIYSLKDQTKEQVGMIAQEIEQFFPEVVATDEDGFKSLAYDRLVVICFKVLKDVIKRLEKLENNGSN